MPVGDFPADAPEDSIKHDIVTGEKFIMKNGRWGKVDMIMEKEIEILTKHDFSECYLPD
jgi:hypothetical protein